MPLALVTTKSGRAKVELAVRGRSAISQIPCRSQNDLGLDPLFAEGEQPSNEAAVLRLEFI